MQVEQLSTHWNIWGLVERSSAGNTHVIHYQGSKIDVLSFYIGMVGPEGKA